MFKFNGNTLGLLLFLFISLKSTSSLSLNKHKKFLPPLNIEVLSPSKFVVHLPERGKGRLVDFRVSINEDLNPSPGVKLEVDRSDGHTLRFFDERLSLKKGDTIYYLEVFEDEDGYHESTGSYAFNDVYKYGKPEIREKRSADDSSEEDSDSDSEANPIQSRFGHHGKRAHHRQHGHGRGYGHGHDEHGYGHGHGHGFGHDRGHGHEDGPPKFGPPGPHNDPFGPPPFGMPPGHPPFHHGPGPWNGHGHGPKDKFDNNGPWDGHGDMNYSGYDGQFGSNKPWNHAGDNFNIHHGTHTKKPWESDNGNANSNNNGSGNGFGNNKPNSGSNSGSDSLGNNGGSNSNDNERNDIDSGFGIESTTGRTTFTTQSTSTTSEMPSITSAVRTSTVPTIDIRFPEVTDDKS